MQQVKCSGIWGGISVADREIRTRSLRATLRSTACGGLQGGDISYFSVCGGDLVTRIALADMRGHGEKVSKLSQWLYGSLCARINAVDASGVLYDLNQLVCDHGLEALTTAAILSYYATEQTLSFAYAGHPPILVWQPPRVWSARPIESGARTANLPLGIMRSTEFDELMIQLEPGDRIVLYTDGVTECPDANGDLFGEDRLLDVLNRNARLDIPEIKRAVFDALRTHAGGELRHDDCTLIVVETSLPQ
jgi:sigma-B regulation protein RsbU (phosphoserine phosphatase)